MARDEADRVVLTQNQKVSLCKRTCISFGLGTVIFRGFGAASEFCISSTGFHASVRKECFEWHLLISLAQAPKVTRHPHTVAPAISLHMLTCLMLGVPLAVNDMNELSDRIHMR